MNAHDIANNAATEAAAVANAKQAEASRLAAFAPHIIGEPRHFYSDGAHGLCGSKVTVIYKISTIAELRELMAAYPPVPCVAFQGTFAGVRTHDGMAKEDAHGLKKREECAGVVLNVERSPTTGAYPCNQHPMAARWWADTPAGRISVRVDFTFNANASWPSIWTEFERRYDRHGRDTGDSVRLLNWGCKMPPSPHFFRYGSGEPGRTPGNYLFFFLDDASLELALDAMEGGE